MSRIYKLKVNHITNPIGYNFDRLNLSFDVLEEPPFQGASFHLQISTDELFDNISYEEDISLENRANIEVEQLTLAPQTRYFWKITARLLNGVIEESERAYFETGLMKEFSADFITPSFQDEHPVLFRSFKINKAVKNARLYISGLGLYEAYINGNKIGDEYLAPYCNDYDEFIQYQTYPLLDLQTGENSISVLLGNGWYKGKFGLNQKSNIYGDKFLCIAELHVEYCDGEKEVIQTDNTWSAKKSFILDSNIYDGEYIDLRKQVDEGIFSVDTVNYDKSRVVERKSLPVVVKDEIIPSLLTNSSGEQILDFGQNMVGFVEFEHHVNEGEKIHLRFGEILQDDHFYQDNLRTAKAEFVVISDGKKNTTRSHFTFYGFRYVKVEGIKQVNPNDFKGKVIYSDLERTGYIKTSDEKINQLIQNALWGQKGNFLDVPTDCPQRDERLGWTADAQVFTATACFNMDSLPFYEKYLHDLKVDQAHFNGGLPNYSPSFKESIPAGSVWGDAATIIPSKLYEFYGDQNLLTKSYPLMKDYVDYVHRIDEETGSTRLYQTGFHFGDWLAQDGMSEQSLKGATDDYYIASVYYYYSATLVSEAADVLGYQDDVRYYSDLATEIKQAIINEYFSPNGRLTIDTQTGYVLSLAFDIYIDKAKIINGLKNRLKKDYYRIKTGFVGTPLICSVLADHGLEEEAYRLLFEQDHPSWLYAVNLGATTIWERWNSVLEDGAISGTNMNSLNHYAYGSIVEFIYSRIAGLQSTEPGFKSVAFKPTPHFQLKEIDCTYHSVSGVYAIKWSIDLQGYLEIAIRKPLNTEASLTLPNYSADLEILTGKGSFISEDILTIDSNEFTCRYKPTVDYNCPYSKKSVILDLMKNQEAKEIIKEKMPVFYSFVNGENDEFISSTLEETAFLPMCFTEPNVVEEVNVQLKSIRV